MKKKLPVVAVAHRDDAARLAELPVEATVDFQDVAVAIQDGLMALCCSVGLAVVAQPMEAEFTDKVGPKGRRDPERSAVRNGSGPGSVTLGGGIVPVRRPRMTRTEEGEARRHAESGLRRDSRSRSHPPSERAGELDLERHGGRTIGGVVTRVLQRLFCQQSPRGQSLRTAVVDVRHRTKGQARAFMATVVTWPERS